MEARFRASMLLAAVGDAMGYHGGLWEFNRNGPLIHQHMMRLTDQQGLRALHLNPKHNFHYSDDTVMHIATAEGLIASSPTQSLHQICTNIAKQYKSCMEFMGGRSPGPTCVRGVNLLNKEGTNWMNLGFDCNGGGCGASMRAACIGLYFHNDLNKLTSVSIESGRMTHHNPLGYLGAYVAALFTAFAIQNKPPNHWLSLLLTQHLPFAKQYVKGARDAQPNLKSGDWDEFDQRWRSFAGKRKMLEDAPSEPYYPELFGVQQREKDYHEFAINGWPGALGVDSVIIAYDALLSALAHCHRNQQANRWEEVCLRGMLHGGDSDSTGTIVGAWYGAIYAMQDVFEPNYEHSEDREYIEQLGSRIFHQQFQEKQPPLPEQISE